MSRPSRTGSSRLVSWGSSRAGPSPCSLGWAAGDRLLFLGLLAVKTATDRLEVPGHPLETILTAHAGADFGHGPEPCRRDRLFTLFARAVVAVTQTLESLGQTVGAFDQEAAGGEVHLAVFID